ncbi:MAG TPA: cytochrome c biogenesis protein CcdA [Candidatus Gastranaerophilaceae bacterium]|nr:cytochrome c biogenesis protein CcdA [Candidatus Gastranaerophilaceae bacterium]
MDNYISLFSQSAGGGEHFQLILLAVSFLGGLLASISPCSLAMLPIIIGYIGGYSKESPIKIFVQMMFFVFGTSLVFATIGVICAVTGKVFISFAPGYFILILASLLMVMGLNILGILDFNLPVIIKQMPQSNGRNMFLYPILLGAVFAIAGTPCSTPILAGIMAFASLSTNIALAVLMLFLFSLGQGLILIIAGVFTSTLKGFKSFAVVSEILLRLSGILLLGSSLYIFYKVFAPLL